jgi:hypothetical protein
MKSVHALAALVALGGCAMVGQWTRPNTTEPEFYQDRFQCEQQAASMYPTVIASSGGSGIGTVQTNCTTYGSQTNCTTSPGITPRPIQYDANAGARTGAINTCLRSKGYVFKIGGNTATPDARPTDNADIGELGGYCNQNCLRGLICSDHKCMKPY